MRTRHFGHAALLLATTLTVWGCDQQDTGEGENGGSGGGISGQGGDDPQGGDPGTGGDIDPDGACGTLDGPRCDAREDCVTRTDVFGDFADCIDAAAAECRFLDQQSCGGRDDCAWDGERCGAPVQSCADHGADACAANGCHWYAEACHEAPPPSQCDQPDEAACEAAGCQWAPVGCRPARVACESVGMQAACQARPDCAWLGNQCRVDPADVPCADREADLCGFGGACLMW